MKKTILLLILIPFLFGFQFVSGRPSSVPPAGFCESQSWNTFTDFRLDFDHDIDSKTACLASGTEVGTDSGTPTVSTPATASPVSGGDALFMNAAEYLAYNNSPAYFISTWGELKISFIITADNTTSLTIFEAEGTDNQEELRIVVGATGIVRGYWEDHNDGAVQFGIAYDIDSSCSGDCYGNWQQVHLKWDPTACSLGDGNCGGTNELASTYRIDANGDGDYDDGGVENWATWAYEVSTNDLGDGETPDSWAVEPGTDDIRYGCTGHDASADCWVADAEISNDQPADMGN